MNWKQLFTNIAGHFAAGFGAAIGAGSTPKAAVIIGIGAVIANMVGLVQTPPKPKEDAVNPQNYQRMV